MIRAVLLHAATGLILTLVSPRLPNLMTQWWAITLIGTVIFGLLMFTSAFGDVCFPGIVTPENWLHVACTYMRATLAMLAMSIVAFRGNLPVLWWTPGVFPAVAMFSVILRAVVHSSEDPGVE